MMGEKLDRIPSPTEKHRIAIHEVGHAILSELTKPNSVATINIASRSNALGYVRLAETDDNYLHTLDHINGKIAITLAGAIAEELSFGNRSTGAANDFKQAAELAKLIIDSGMSVLGIVAPEYIPKELLHTTVASILKEVESSVHKILSSHQTILNIITSALLEKESMNGDDFRLLLKSC